MKKRPRGAPARPQTSTILERGLELHADRARVVDEAGQVVEVDAAGHADLVRDVAREGRHFVLAAVPVVAGAQAAMSSCPPSRPWPARRPPTVISLPVNCLDS